MKSVFLAKILMGEIVSLRLVLVFVLLLQHTLVNTVAASVHLSAEDHSVRETPHIHSLSALVDIFSLQSDNDHHDSHSPIPHGEEGHDTRDEVHVHVVFPLAHITEVALIDMQSEQPLSAYHSYQGITYKPLLPPPNA